MRQSMHLTGDRARVHLGLRMRILLAFTLGALVLSTVSGVIVFAVVRRTSVSQRERASDSQVYGNARVVRDSLRATVPDVTETLNSLPTLSASRPVLYYRGGWFAVNLEFGERELPLALRTMVLDGQPGRVRYELGGEAQLGVGVPLPEVGAAYFEIVSLSDLDGTLNSVGMSLIAAAAGSTLAGFALGVWVSRRVLRPLAAVGAAAEAIAGGRLDTRLVPSGDIDLEPIITSFNDMATALQERLERDTRFASDVSHELRSPLTTLAASVAVIESRRDELPERSQAALDLLSADLARFQRMVEDLLEISRADSGAVVLDLEHVRTAELVLNAVRGATGSGDYPVEIQADAGSTIVLADKRRLTRVIANLVDNARKYGGGVTRLAVERSDVGVRLIVEDGGAGVAPEDRDRVFERFSRGASVAGRRGSSDGVGLGLALVREHVQLHGGSIWVEDAEGGGARFVIELPAHDDVESLDEPGMAVEA